MTFGSEKRNRTLPFLARIAHGQAHRAGLRHDRLVGGAVIARIGERIDPDAVGEIVDARLLQVGARNGRDAIRDIVSYAVSSDEPERLNDWGTMTCGNGKRLSLSVLRLEDGATQVTFAGAALPSDSQPTGTTAMAA